MEVVVNSINLTCCSVFLLLCKYLTKYIIKNIIENLLINILLNCVIIL